MEDLDFSAERAAQDLAQLASPQMAGRLPGSRGERVAAEYLCQQLRRAGIQPLEKHLRQPFALQVPELRATPTLRLVDGTDFEHLKDFTVNVQGASAGGQLQAQCVWLGAPASKQDLPASLTGRIGVCWGLPPTASPQQKLTHYLKTLQLAVQAGAAALLRVSPQPHIYKVMQHRVTTPAIPCCDISLHLAQQLFTDYPPQSPGQLSPPLLMDIPLQRNNVQSAGNIVACLGQGPQKKAVSCVLCAHYDHIGALPDGRYFPGAADNASGVAVVLECARLLAQRQPQQRTIVLLTSAEEMGALGAAHFVEKYGHLLDAKTLLLNLDEVAGDRGQPLYLLRAADFPTNLLNAEDAVQLGTEVKTARIDAAGFADYAPFLQKGLPLVASLMSRAPGQDHVHTLDDKPETVPEQALAIAGDAVMLMLRRYLGAGG